MGSLLKGKELDTVLKTLYFNPKSPVSFGGVQELYKAVKRLKRFKTVKRNDVTTWLNGQKTYTLHKPIRKRFPRRKTVVAGIDQQWQADLSDLQTLSKFNNNKRYLLCVIDVFSKYAWVTPIQNKSGKTLIQAFQTIIRSSKRKPLSLQTDKGSEFKNKDFQKYLKKQNIHYFTTENPETKASIVERFQKTLKTKMWKYFTHNQTRKYIDILKDLVTGYNKSFHRSIQKRPIDVNKSNEVEVTRSLYGKKKYVSKKSRTLDVGTMVRINKTKRTFDKGYLPNWTQELFKIIHVNQLSSPTTYIVEDLAGERIKGTFYRHEIQAIKDDSVYEIESVLDTRTRREGKRKIKEIKVHWLGYPSKFDSWIPQSDLV